MLDDPPSEENRGCIFKATCLLAFSWTVDVSSPQSKWVICQEDLANASMVPQAKEALRKQTSLKETWPTS